MMPTRFIWPCSKNAVSATGWGRQKTCWPGSSGCICIAGIGYLAAPQTIRSIGDLIRLAREEGGSEA